MDILTRKLIEAKNEIRKESYLTYKDFILDHQYKPHPSGIGVYDGLYGASESSTFYSLLLAGSDVDITDFNACVSFMNTEYAKIEMSHVFTKRYIRPVKKLLKKKRIHNKQLFSFLVRQKLNIDSELFSLKLKQLYSMEPEEFSYSSVVLLFAI